jgi:hypothetical protein
MRASTRSSAPAVIFTAFVVLTFYTLGAGYLESFVNYPLWHVIGGTDQWRAYHVALGPRVVVVLAVPALVLQLIANVLLLFRRPPAVPLWAAAVTLILLIVAVVSTAAIQIPIQTQLDIAYDRAVVDRLIVTSLWLREVPAGIRAAIVALLLYRIARMPRSAS